MGTNEKITSLKLESWILSGLRTLDVDMQDFREFKITILYCH